MALYKQLNLPFYIKRNISGYLSKKEILNDIEGYYRLKKSIKNITQENLDTLISNFIYRSEPQTILNILKRCNNHNNNIKILKENIEKGVGYYPASSYNVNIFNFYNLLEKFKYNNSFSFKLLFGLFNNEEREWVVCDILDKQERRDNINPKISLINKIVSNSHVEIVNIIIKYYGVNYKDMFGWTMLHYACFNGNLKIVKNLLESKADMHVLNLNGKSPFHYANLKNQQHIIKNIKYLIGK